MLLWLLVILPAARKKEEEEEEEKKKKRKEKKVGVAGWVGGGGGISDFRMHFTTPQALLSPRQEEGGKCGLRLSLSSVRFELSLRKLFTETNRVSVLIASEVRRNNS